MSASTHRPRVPTPRDRTSPARPRLDRRSCANVLARRAIARPSSGARAKRRTTAPPGSGRDAEPYDADQRRRAPVISTARLASDSSRGLRALRAAAGLGPAWTHGGGKALGELGLGLRLSGLWRGFVLAPAVMPALSSRGLPLPVLARPRAAGVPIGVVALAQIIEALQSA
jgi:hypothetical protein